MLSLTQGLTSESIGLDAVNTTIITSTGQSNQNSTTSSEDDDTAAGAMYYVVAVCLVYSMAMVLMIGANLRRKKTHYRDDKDVSNYFKYLDKRKDRGTIFGMEIELNINPQVNDYSDIADARRQRRPRVKNTQTQTNPEHVGQAWVLSEGYIVTSSMSNGDSSRDSSYQYGYSDGNPNSPSAGLRFIDDEDSTVSGSDSSHLLSAPQSVTETAV